MTEAFDPGDGDALVVGASRGIGLALATALARGEMPLPQESGDGKTTPRRLFVTYRGETAPDTLLELKETSDLEVIAQSCELTEDRDLARLGETLRERDAELTLVLHAAGILHDGDLQPEKALDQAARNQLMRLFEVNSVAPLLMARTVLEHMPRQRPGHFAALSAMVGSIGDNRIGGWYGYRASKAALNQFLRTLAIEVRRTHPGLCVTSIHPGTTDTGLSKPFQGNVPKDKLYTPERSAERILRVVMNGRPEDSGRFMNWTGEPLPW